VLYRWTQSGGYKAAECPFPVSEAPKAKIAVVSAYCIVVSVQLQAEGLRVVHPGLQGAGAGLVAGLLRLGEGSGGRRRLPPPGFEVIPAIAGVVVQGVPVDVPLNNGEVVVRWLHDHHAVVVALQLGAQADTAGMVAAGRGNPLLHLLFPRSCLLQHLLFPRSSLLLLLLLWLLLLLFLQLQIQTGIGGRVPQVAYIRLVFHPLELDGR